MQSEPQRNNVYQSVELLLFVLMLFVQVIPKCLLIFKGPMTCQNMFHSNVTVHQINNLCHIIFFINSSCNWVKIDDVQDKIGHFSIKCVG